MKRIFIVILNLCFLAQPSWAVITPPQSQEALTQAFENFLQGKELYYALKKRGVPVKMLLFTNEEEEVNLSSRSIKAGLEHTIAWLEQFLSLDPNNRGSSDVTHKKENAK